MATQYPAKLHASALHRLRRSVMAGRLHLALACSLLVLSNLLALLRLDAPLALTQTLPRGLDAANAEELLQWLDTQLTGQLARHSVPGMAVALRVGERELLWQAGSRVAGGHQPLSATTPFEAASLSKPVAAYAALRLVRKGLLQLDAPIERGGRRFTLRQLLSHQAGFDNALQSRPQPVAEAGSFRYAGNGYLVLAKLIEEASGQDFKTHMNTVVLPELGMAHSHFGAQPAGNESLAQPSIDLALPLAVMTVAASLLALLLGGAYLLACRFRPRLRVANWLPKLLGALVLAPAVGLVALGLGWTVALLCAAALLTGLLAWRLARSPRRALRGQALLLALGWTGLLIARPALPLPERQPMFLAAAGLRTTAADYAAFLAQVMRRSKDEPLMAEMLQPQARLSEHMAWGLGWGLQTRDGRTIAWHWGVNFPGYQALALAEPATGRVAVVLTNGGALSFAPGGLRYSGLELARQVAVDWLGGVHGGFWAEIP